MFENARSNARKAVMRFIHDAAEEVADAFSYDPVGELTVREAAEMVGDYNNLSVAAAERILALAEMLGRVGSKGVVDEKAAAAAEFEAKNPGKRRITDPETIARLARKAGVDPSQVIAYQDDAPLKNDGGYVDTAKGKVKISDVPLGEDGQPTPEWLDEYCPCEEHAAKRKAKRERQSNEKASPYI